MKKTGLLLITLVVMFALSAGAQSVVDVAKQARAKQKANPNARVIDNDVIPSSIEISSSSAPAANSSASAATSNTADTKPAPASTPAETKKDETGKQDGAKDDKASSEKSPGADDDKKNIDAWKKQINDQKKEVSQLERELNVAQREAGLHNAVYYADAGAMLRDSAKFADESRKLQAEIDTKTQALADAKQKLADLQEDARKAGVPQNQLD